MCIAPAGSQLTKAPARRSLTRNCVNAWREHIAAIAFIGNDSPAVQMTIGKNFGMALRAVLGIAALLLATACSDPNDSSANNKASSVGAPAHETVLRRGNGAEVESLDPALADTSWEQWIIGDMMMGLYTEDAKGNAIYGVAQNAPPSPPAKIWTFTLRDSLWSDGTPATA